MVRGKQKPVQVILNKIQYIKMVVWLVKVCFLITPSVKVKPTHNCVHMHMSHV